MISQHILFIGFVWPEPNSSAGGSRTIQLINLFLSKGYIVTFASAASNSEFAIDLETLGVKKVNIELNNQSFDVFLKKLQPSIVVFDKFMIEEQFGWRVEENCPHALRILDTIDLHCLRLARQNAFKENRAFTYSDLISDVAKREIASIFRCDISLIISDFEMNLLKEYFKVDEQLLYYLPFLLDPVDEKIISNSFPFEDRTSFITIGNFLHEPNWNAILFLKEEIWPLIRKKLPQAELYVYGSYASQKVNELNKPKEGFYIKGRATDAKEVVRKARVCLAPLRFGAGIKGKLVEAMQCGTPSVTSNIGAEGMHGIYEWNGIIANTPQGIADAAVELYSNKTLWLKSQKNGVNIVNNFYSKDVLGAKFLSYILFSIQHLEKKRSENFIGAMLMHHSAASTKYMSKWIEAKNK
jgi:glycosyltransferase involved in cell wall biosynthesis